ncbi:class Ib ribonucleoside-diphosphate reductase assembly flavoprotein NrdI [Macrococcoides caseolyticum]|uniref:class Ib ribonucleoside-diphosphate reductase assembly flavoprotein NrdI n=1 Tax=Macrococcoides caseolyticum TaxID=69966 RepID=UPI001F3B4164|nr:class Ib ribonucleoside-diphosphate reductase assembly flavoprotein NrdI [Macrococcus caseolyticus]MCE4955868.1 class Ib ribonucleoside-diphosphate reductase assembly flavoprotein NrdI [Macrococcus caseolyticus]
MLIIYYSLTGNVRRFIEKSKQPHTLPLESALTTEIQEPFILVTGTIGFGQVPDAVSQFLMKYHHHLYAVVASGNRNWGQNFAKAGDIISATYHVPLLMKFELHGNMRDIELFNKKVEECYENSRRETIQSY